MKGFAHEKGSEDYVSCRINNGEVIPEINTKNICAENYLYDLPELGEEKEQLIEKFYANNVDGNFPEILEFAKDEKQNQLSEELRSKIILSCVSLIFRTPKFLRTDPDILELHSRIEGDDIETERKKKAIALEKHFEKSIELIKLKYENGIVINKAPKGSQFITCDNPVILRDPTGGFNDYFDPSNFIHLPISPDYSISITPNVESTLVDTFSRFSMNHAGVLTINHDINKLHELFLVGARGGIEQFDTEMDLYDKPTPEGLKMLANEKKMAAILSNIDEVVEQFGISSVECKELMMKYWNEEELVKGDENFIKLMRELDLL
jgi:hypothetical protein